jgi:mannosyl-oligosaccharide glucosidase
VQSLGPTLSPVSAQASGPHREHAERLHAELRGNLLRTVVGEAVRSGYLWESYDEGTGRGRGSHPFTGWTALVVLIAGDSYLDI